MWNIFVHCLYVHKCVQVFVHAFMHVCTWVRVASMQEPITIELGTTYQYKRSGAKRSLVGKYESFQYIPLIDNLEWL